MGTYISAWAEKVNPDGTFTTLTNVWDIQSYNLFGWLADVKNHAAITPLASVRRELPPGYSRSDEDWAIGVWAGNGATLRWVSVADLLAVDYEVLFENRRDNGDTLPAGSGVMTSLREFLPSEFFSDLEEAKNEGADRIVFFFY